MERVLLEAFSKPVRNGEHQEESEWVYQGKSCSGNVTAFYDRTTRYLDKVEAMGTACLDFIKAFDTISYKSLNWKVMQYGLGKPTLR